MALGRLVSGGWEGGKPLHICRRRGGFWVAVKTWLLLEAVVRYSVCLPPSKVGVERPASLKLMSFLVNLGTHRQQGILEDVHSGNRNN